MINQKIILNIIAIGLVVSLISLASSTNFQVGRTFNQASLDNLNISNINYYDLNPRIVAVGITKSNGINIIGVVTSNLDFKPHGDGYIIYEKQSAFPLMTYRDYEKCIVVEGGKSNCINNRIKPIIIQSVKQSMDSSLEKAKRYQNQKVTIGFDYNDIIISASDF